MNSDLKARWIGAGLVGCAIITPHGKAGGLILYEIATPDVGLASAGYAARAADASTAFKNPAGMSQLTQAQFQGGLQALYGSVSLTPDGNTSSRLGSADGGNALGWLPGASAFAVIPLGDRVRVGVGALSYFGLVGSYDDDWVGRYYVQDSTLLGMTLTPSASFEVTRWLSIGAGLNAMYGLLETEMAINNLTQPDGEMSLKDQTWGFGATAGILIRASENTRLGVTYLSALELDFSDTPEFTGLGPGVSAIQANRPTLDLGITVPQSVMVSAYHALNLNWRF